MPPFGKGLIQPLLPELALLYPKIQIELALESKVVDMIVDGFDISIRVGQMLQPTLLARPIAPLNFAVVGSPGYFRTHGVPRHLDDLSKHCCVAGAAASGSDAKTDSPKSAWRLGEFNNPTIVYTPVSLVSNDLSILLASAIQGQGLFYCPLPLALPHLIRGELQIALPDWIGTGLTVFLHYPSRRNLAARVKLVVDHLLTKLRDHQYLKPVTAEDLKLWTAQL